MRLAIFGGSFDPIHVGHLYIAEEVRMSLGYDRILFVPSNIPPHKRPSQKVNGEDRLRMIRLATQGNDAFAVDDYELRAGGVSYTIGTIHYVMESYDIEGKPGLIIGDDLVPGFPSWRSAEEIRSLTDIVVARRSGLNVDHAGLSVSNVLVPVSSSDIRDRIVSGRPFRYLVPENVYDYIFNNKLYLH